MSLYSEISRYYDGLFTVEQGSMSYVNTLLAGKERLLDVGCGSGNMTELFAAPGREVVGIDSNATMIDLAGQAHVKPGVCYKAMDMMAIDEHFGFSAFDAVLCFGNTLAHLPSRGPVSAFCGKAAYVLEPDGLLIIQILNYDRILSQKISELPPLESDQARMTRRYDWQDGRMLFVVELTDKQTGQVTEAGTELYPMGRGEFAAVLHTAGFRNIDWYGSALGAPLEEDSFAIMAVCKR